MAVVLMEVARDDLMVLAANHATHAGLSRESLYKALSGEGNPQFETIFRVLTALGIRLRAEPAKKKKRAA